MNFGDKKEWNKLTYDELLLQADFEKLLVKEAPLLGNDGRIKGNRIAIRKDIPTLKQKSCVLAEELGHYYTSYGDILDQNLIENRKQEQRARVWAYNKLIGLAGIINAYKAQCHNKFEIAEFLDVTEEFLSEALSYYKSKYGICTGFEQYVIYFEPAIGVFETYKWTRKKLPATNRELNDSNLQINVWWILT